ncbi:hypothetical protein GCM10009820_00900 [Leifsonia soli]
MRIFCPAMSDSLSCYGVVRDDPLESFFALDAGDVRVERHYSSVNSSTPALGRVTLRTAQS